MLLNAKLIDTCFLLIIPLTRNLIFKQLGKKYGKGKIKDDLIEGEYEDKDN